MQERLANVLAAIEKIQSEDPNNLKVDGEFIPKEVLYGKRMTTMLYDYDEHPSELLQIAAKGQHIKRWEVPRDSYPDDRAGYLKWRTILKMNHGKLLNELMLDAGYPKADAQKVNDLVTKKKLKTDAETQKLEDVICLVFLKHYLGDFSHEHPKEKVISILQKTWAKMTEKGHRLAHLLQLNATEKELVTEALR